ncbi:MAG: NAD-dependent epimerase/dehydratase family protein [Verrucomicrobiae bacterium]|nr:NAD-dependent epimerase/dehydratase family protein [Verrucomicrobiae bacterium]
MSQLPRPSSLDPRPSVLIAGVGYLGAPLAEKLAASGFSVVGLARSAPDLTGSGPGPYPVESADLGDADSIASLAKRIGPVSAIVHCASSGRGGAEAYRAVFVDGTRHLIESFPGASLFFTSSTSVYGQTDGSLVTEASPADPDRETGQLLRAAEDQVIAAGGTVLRLAGIYGPGRSVHLQKFLNGTAAIESGDVSRLLNQIHRDDAVDAIVHLLGLSTEKVSGQIFNVADDTPLSQRATYEALAEYFQKPLPPEAPPDLNRKRAWTHKSISNAKLRATGWAPAHPSFPGALKTDPTLIDSIRTVIGDR